MKGSPTSWRPAGKPWLVRPHGTEIAGRPSRLKGLVRGGEDAPHVRGRRFGLHAHHALVNSGGRHRDRGECEEVYALPHGAHALADDRARALGGR